MKEKLNPNPNADKLIAALKLLGIKADRPYDHGVSAQLSPNQELWARVGDYDLKSGKYSITCSSNAKLFREISISQYQNITIGVATTKTVEQIAQDIEKRILKTEQFSLNNLYLIKRMVEDAEYHRDLSNNIQFFADNSGLIFKTNDNGEVSNTASEWKNTKQGYLSIKAEVSSNIDYCEMTIRGLTQNQWVQVLKVIKPLIEAEEF